MSARVCACVCVCLCGVFVCVYMCGRACERVGVRVCVCAGLRREDEAARITAGLLRALDALHDIGVLHRDIKVPACGGGGTR